MADRLTAYPRRPDGSSQMTTKFFLVQQADGTFPTKQEAYPLGPDGRTVELEAVVFVNANGEFLPMDAFTASGFIQTLLPAQDAEEARSILDVYSTVEVDGAIAAVVDAAPGQLDTLNELAAALGDDANFAATVTTALGLRPTSAALALASGSTQIGWSKEDSLQAMNLSTALRLGLPLMPEHFAPNGVIDYDDPDEVMDAFGLLSDFVSDAGGGFVVHLKAGQVYAVGRQTLVNGSTPSGWMIEPDPVLHFVGCTKPVAVEGNGARLRCVDGLKYGTFDSSGNALVGQQSLDKVGSPYKGMIWFEECVGGCSVRNIELDGNANEYILGGGYGDVDRQIPCTGIFFYETEGDIFVENVWTHHNGLDGIQISHANHNSTSDDNIVFINVNSEYNGRQGVSIVSGRGGKFERCKFNHTGQIDFSSAPKAGVDIESNSGRSVKNWIFSQCEMINNKGVGMLADVGTNRDCKFKYCTFVGTENYAVWPQMPGFVFEDCLMVGVTLNTYVDATAGADATKFVRCKFVNDTSLSPTGTVYLGAGGTSRLVELNGARGTLLDRCDIIATGAALAFFSDNSANRVNNTNISQVSATTLSPTATWSGHNTIVSAGTTSAAGTFRGTVTVNGSVVAYTFAHTGRVTSTDIVRSTGNTGGATGGSAAELSYDTGNNRALIGGFDRSTGTAQVTGLFGSELRILIGNTLTLEGTFDANGLNLVTGNRYAINALQVVGSRKTGWAVATGTATRTTFDTASVTLPQLAERVKALIDDLHATAGHGLIGT